MEICLKKANRPYGKKLMVLIRLRMRNGAVALFAMGIMRKSNSAKNVAIGIQKMKFMTDGVKSACEKASTMTRFLSTARQIRTNSILTHLLCARF